jgi:hypothetical protein
MPAGREQAAGRIHPSAASNGDNLILYEMKPDYTRAIGLLEVTLHRILHHEAQLLERLTLREYGIAKRMRLIATLGGLFDVEDDLFVGHKRSSDVIIVGIKAPPDALRGGEP